jgi:ribonuclease HI
MLPVRPIDWTPYTGRSKTGAQRVESVPRKEVLLAVDGASSGNPGPGGWAAILVSNGHTRELSGAVLHATSNQMELLAVLQGIQALKQPSRVRVLTDSANVVGWLSQGWKRRNAIVQALAARIEAAARAGGHTLSLEKVPGHAGHRLNERANYLAQRETRRPSRPPESLERYLEQRNPPLPLGEGQAES